MSLRPTVLTLFVVSLVAILVAFVFPWHQADGAAEWDDGEHVWGRNIHDTSILANDLGTEIEEDPDGVTLRQVGFYTFTAGLSFTTIALLFAIADRRAWTISLGWFAWILVAGGTGAALTGILYELNDVGDLGVQTGLVAAAVAVVIGLVNNFLAIGLGKTEKSLARREAYLEAKAARKEARLEARSVQGDATQ